MQSTDHAHAENTRGTPRVKPRMAADGDSRRRVKKRESKLIRKSQSAHVPWYASVFVYQLQKLRLRKLQKISRELVRPGLGIFAADDSKRQVEVTLRSLNLDVNDANRRRLHELFLCGNPDLKLSLSGVLLREENLLPMLHRGKSLGSVAQLVKEQKLTLGIRLDKGVVPLAGTLNEYTTSGLDTLEAVCTRIRGKGAEFALWRCVYVISPYTPSTLAILENSNTLARFAAACQQADLVPIVSPEVLQDGSHDYEHAQRVLCEILAGLMKAMATHRVILEGLVIRISPASPGMCYRGDLDLQLIAMNTMKTLNQCVPPAIGGVLLARDHDLARSVAILSEVLNCPIKKPFIVSFCFSQLLQRGLYQVWAGQDFNLDKVRTEFQTRIKTCSLASYGQRSEGTGAFHNPVLFHY